MSKKFAEFPGVARIALHQGMLREPPGTPFPEGRHKPPKSWCKGGIYPLGAASLLESKAMAQLSLQQGRRSWHICCHRYQRIWCQVCRGRSCDTAVTPRWLHTVLTSGTHSHFHTVQGTGCAGNIPKSQTTDKGNIPLTFKKRTLHGPRTGRNLGKYFRVTVWFGLGETLNLS